MNKLEFLLSKKLPLWFVMKIHNDKPNIVFNKHNSGQWECNYQGLYYCGNTPKEAYKNCEKFYYPTKSYDSRLYYV